MNETYVTIRGRLTADPTVRTTRSGAPMTTFRIAHSARRPVQGRPGQWEDTEASFYDVVTFRSLAANIAVSLRRGHPVTVHGKQRTTSWQGDDGATRNGVEIEADAVGHDLTFGTTAFARVGMGRASESWSPGEGAGPQGEGAVHQGGRPDDVPGAGRVGDPEHDPYVVDPVLEPAHGGADDAGPGADSGPLVRPGKGAAA